MNFLILPTDIADLPNHHGNMPVAGPASAQRPAHRSVSLRDRYERAEGVAYLTGLQALVRIPLEQHRIDARHGRDTRTLISGYEGSPLAGYDLELQRQSALLGEHGVVFRPNVNEELGANAVQGSQLASVAGQLTCDGVVGIWYGKAPGLDRATDALRHGNLGGASPAGGVLVLVGDDSIAKSSTVPSSSEVAMAEIGMTVLSPCDAADVLELGLHGIALSRFCGLWTGLKLATNVVDGGTTVDLPSLDVQPRVPDNVVDGLPYAHTVSASFLQPALAGLERSAVWTRPELARRYARANGLNRITGDPAAAVGVIAHGATYLDTLKALARLGIDVSAPGSGVRVLKLGMISPLDPEIVTTFAAGLTRIIVVEEKRAFVELAVKDVLYGAPGAPDIYGKRGPNGQALLRPDADLPPEVIATALAACLPGHLPGFVPPSAAASALAAPAAGEVRHRAALPLLVRQPYFCSGCPHNRSTRVPEGSLVGGGIGCSALVSFMDSDRFGESLGLCQMGGEGAAWAGMSPFVKETHIFQNLGDGTFHHSGVLAIRSAVAAGVNITYKLLYNGTVAMTGGQQAVGRLAVPELAQELLLEGVRRVVITTEDESRYRGVSLPAGVALRNRDRLIETQEELARTPGVTVLIHDQECATELRRKRKRGKVADPVQRAFINERVCEGCGDCGAKSNCLSVQPVDTDFGRKTRIQQSTCNHDYSCLDGDCPSFLVVTPGTAKSGPAPAKSGAAASGAAVARPAPDALGADALGADALAAPEVRVEADGFGLRMTGIGGTGVVTTSQVLATAAVIDGLFVRGLDQLGMAQKGGAVVSDLVLTRDRDTLPNKVAPGECDLYLGLDLLVAADDRNLAAMAADRTVAVLSTSEVPTGAMVSHVGVAFPPAERTVDVIAGRARDTVTADARDLCLRLFGDDQFANILMIGVACQAGALPLSPESIEGAITLNGAAVERNLQAFRRGRQWVADPVAVARLLTPVGPADTGPRGPGLEDDGPQDPGLGDQSVDGKIARLAADLVAYQNKAYASRYRSLVEETAARERAVTGATGALTEAVATHLHKLMAYKDEYEVARLSIDPRLRRAVEAEFGPGATYGYKLHPPVLRTFGMRRKITLRGRSAQGAFRVLRGMRALRGTSLDPFGHTEVRRVERELVGEYSDAVRSLLRDLAPERHDLAVEIASLPDMVRGYEQIKLDNVAAYRSRLADLLHEVKIVVRSATADTLTD
jgi:indolepyruvate ferredoxin oxidoreductase